MNDDLFDLANPKMVGDKNKASIIRLIRSKGPISRAEIARQLNLSPPAVSNNISSLLDAGIIEEVGTDESRIGRKPILLRFNSAFGYVLGVDIGEYRIRCAIANMDGDIADLIELPTMADKGGEQVLQQVKKAVGQVLEKNNISADRVLAAGIGSPGIKSSSTGGRVLAPFIEAWDQVDLNARMAEAFPFSVTVENDVDMDVIGERWRGAGRKYNNMAYIKLSDGVAARFILNGKLYRGANLAAGEIGFMLLDKELVQDEFCAQGSLERLICNDAVARQYNEMYNKKYGCAAPDEEITIERIFDKWENGDDIAAAIVEEIKLYLGMALINIVAVLNPEAIILGGQVSTVNNDFIAVLKDMLYKHVPFVPDIVPAQLGSKAGVAGAIAVALYKAEELMPVFWE